MKLLHLADLHFGRLLYGRSLIEDQRHFVENILLPAIDTEQPDVLLIAGDVFDRPIASTEAIALFDALLNALSARSLPTVIISGNHDGPERMAVGAKLLKQLQIHISTTLSDAFSPITVGDVQIFPLPYFDNAQVRDYFGDDTLRGSAACMRKVIEHIQSLFLPDKKHVLMAHCFAAGAETSDSESQMFVGGAGDVPTDLFSAFDYTALGHLHAAQKAGQFARYAGSPLKYSVDEAHQKKSLTFVTLAGETDIKLLPIVPLRDVRRVSGSFEELITAGEAQPVSDYVEIELTDKAPIFRPADRLRPYYPNILSVRNLWFAQESHYRSVQNVREQDTGTVFTAFMKDVCGTEIEPEDLELLLSIMQEVEG